MYAGSVSAGADPCVSLRAVALAARAPTRSDRRDLEAWINASPTRQEFGKIRAQRDALRQLRGALVGACEERLLLPGANTT